jgi:hypothetical protein
MSAALQPCVMDSIDAAVDAVLEAIPGDIVLGTPLGIGKPNPFINALYQRIKANPSRRLTIVTALSLEKPVGKVTWRGIFWSRWWNACSPTTPTSTM